MAFRPGAVVGCGAALGDYILSKFGLSPIEYFIAITLESCGTKMKLARALEKVDLVRQIPTIAAQKIVGKAKGLLKTKLPKPFGEEAASLFCDESKMTVAAPKIDKSDICPHVASPYSFKGKSSKIPASVYRYKKGDRRNDPKKEAQWKGWDEKVPPALTPPPPSGGDGDKSGSSGSTEAADSIKEGKVDSKERATVSLEIHGGFNPKKRYNGKTAYPVHVSAVSSTGAVYGPLPVEIFVFRVKKAGKGWRITYTFRIKTPGNNIVMIDGKTGRRFELHHSGTKKFTSPLRPQITGGK